MLGNRDVDRMLLMFCPAEFFLENKNRYVRKICDETFWKKKLEKDFPLRSKFVYFSITPKKLYFLLTHHKSRIFELPEMEFYNDINKIIPEKFPNILRGDVVRLDNYNYRNMGKAIWDGERIINIGYSADDYGNAPEEICFPEVPLDFYFNSIDHNTYIYITEEKAQEIIATGKLSDNYKYYPIIINSPITPKKQIISANDGCGFSIEWLFFFRVTRFACSLSSLVGRFGPKGTKSSSFGVARFVAKENDLVPLGPNRPTRALRDALRAKEVRRTD